MSVYFPGFLPLFNGKRYLLTSLEGFLMEIKFCTDLRILKFSYLVSMFNARHCDNDNAIYFCCHRLSLDKYVYIKSEDR